MRLAWSRCGELPPVLSLPLIALVGLGAACAFAGALGGIGGATLLVPVLLLLDVDPLVAAPLGMLTVASGSLAAASRQIDDGLVHHRLGLTVELFASVGTVAGALASTQVSEVWLSRILGGAALVGAVAAIARKGIRNTPVGIFDDEPAGEWPGTLGGSYSLKGQVVPYHARHVPAGLGLSVAAGVVSGLAGVGGGFLKTPAMSEVMKVPVKVAAATTTFVSGITAATALLIYAGQGRLDVRGGAGVVAGALVGGVTGARLQSGLHATTVRRVTGALLVVVAVAVIGRSW
ncbi:MAG: sulfite exporter TauE/SafE family protein [Microthrixaceae bacterium]